MATRPPKTAPSWRVSLDALREVHLELMRLAPYRDYGLASNPSASLIDIEDAELELGVRLPTAYREFLTYSNGWQRFFDGASLLGTKDLGSRELRAEASALLRRALPAGLMDDRFLLPFGADPHRTTLFAFDYTRGGREPSVVAWVQELGVNSAGFTEFLDFLLSLSRGDLSDERARASVGVGATRDQKGRAVTAA